MKYLIYIVTTILLVTSCQSQTEKRESTKIVGGPCEGCEAIYEFGDRALTSFDTLPEFQDTEPKLKISGTVYKKDGKTPVENVIIYIYHTDRKGIYKSKGDEKGWAKRHGYIRGWVKTGKDGKYSFYTFRPAAYPDRQEPEHIHMTVKEPNKNEYYIDAIRFKSDPKLSDSEKEKLKNRAGTGVIILGNEEGILLGNRDIILGVNIPNYD